MQAVPTDGKVLARKSGLMCEVRLGGSPAEYLLLVLRGRSHPAASDYWDGNWLDCEAEVVAGPFQGRLGGCIRVEELQDFGAALSTLYERLRGEATFTTMEQWLEVRVTGDGRGHMEVCGRLCDDLVAGNTLVFRLHLDQTYLPPVLRQLATALGTYPVVGQRGE
jgi:hypothetical protein